MAPSTNRSPLDLSPKLPIQTFASDGGTLEIWSPSQLAMVHPAQVGASKLTLYPLGLSLPAYSDSAQIFYVLEGTGLVGVVFPESEKECVRKVRRGDVVALPLGSVHWWYNGSSAQLSVLSLGDTSNAHLSGEYTNFHLMGHKDGGQGSVMHGFTPDFVAQAWDLDQGSLKKLLGSQKGAVIVKIREGLVMPEPSSEDEAPASYGEFIYNCEDAKKDVDVKNGGRVAVLTSDNLAILKHIHLGADLVKLDPGAMCSPGFSPDAAFQVTYVVRGSGRVQVVSNEGERVLDTELRGGYLFIVPRFYIVSKRAGKEGLEWFSIITTEKPIFTHLSGRTSVWKALSPQVICAAFNVDEELEQTFRGRRTKDAIFFPPSDPPTI